ncbi:MAG: hypothetical protein QFX33_01500 [Candidatus Nezhaarchaeota archaeon]|nr:hypothetical protein [Candidatus Nezhaarchaeota archaeon]
MPYLPAPEDRNVMALDIELTVYTIPSSPRRKASCVTTLSR